MRFWGYAVCGIALAACTSSITDDIAPIDGSGGVFRDATTDSSFPLPDGSFDAPIETTPFNGGGLFLCQGCVCDGTLNMCLFGGGGGGAPVTGDAGDDAGDFGDASECPAEDAGFTPCVQIPIQCLPSPTCDCIVQVNGGAGCTCAVDPGGSGLVVTCPPKP